MQGACMQRRPQVLFHPRLLSLSLSFTVPSVLAHCVLNVLLGVGAQVSLRSMRKPQTPINVAVSLSMQSGYSNWFASANGRLAGRFPVAQTRRTRLGIYGSCSGNDKEKQRLVMRSLLSDAVEMTH
ncbi:hypothetical protein C8R47DRAFT_748283 [Mycena vitilis]|nr:hypothetical protein C8R47DRAFT_748283 [Mycena vitilis]